MDPIQLILLAIVLVVVFFYLGWMFNSRIGKKSIASAEERAKQIINDAQKESNNLKREKLLEVKDEWYKKKTEFDNEVQQKRQNLRNLEKQLVAREESTEKKFELVLKKERESK
ncbi:MAG: Rnase Y domain-containing protein, partial [Ignavibacteria bacterium]|nr:Rnase Y domain-containing protein [Ignavibacteria bacterium]